MPSHSTYDGGDQEFWRKFYAPWNELPARYQAHQALRMAYADWMQVRALHAIYGLRSQSRLPAVLRPLIVRASGDIERRASARALPRHAAI